MCARLRQQIFFKAYRSTLAREQTKRILQDLSFHFIYFSSRYYYYVSPERAVLFSGCNESIFFFLFFRTRADSDDDPKWYKGERLISIDLYINMYICIKICTHRGRLVAESYERISRLRGEMCRDEKKKKKKIENDWKNCFSQEIERSGTRKNVKSV